MVLLVYCTFIVALLVLALISIYFIWEMIAEKVSISFKAKKKKKIESLMQKHLQYERIKEIPKEEIEEVKKITHSKFGLEMFYHCVKQYEEERGFDQRIKEYISRIIDYQLILKNKIVKVRYQFSYVLFLMAEFRMFESYNRDMLLEALNHKSMYVRNNALRMISFSGDYDLYFETLKFIDGSDRYYGEKILIDSMGSCCYACKDFNERISMDMQEFSSGMKALLVSHFRNFNYQDTVLAETLLKSLESGDKELQLSAAKYFGSIYVEEAGKQMLAHLKHEEWEIRAVSARNLRNYNSIKVRKALMEALKDPVWYVRYNAAFSLIRICNEEKEYLQVLNGEDSFAKNILIYAMFEFGKINYEQYLAMVGGEAE